MNNYFWDSCVFIRYLTGARGDHYFEDIEQHLEDVKAGKTRIYYSTIALAEIKPSQLYQKHYGDINIFLRDFTGSFLGIGPTPDILGRAGNIRDIAYPSPNGGNDRVLGTADAIHLLTCVYVRDVLGINDIVFHTLDNGKGANWEGRCVPLLEFEKWTAGIAKNPYVPGVVSLNRALPLHPELPML